MGLSKESVGFGAVDSGLIINKNQETDKVIALGGNPNVGKSTVFNELTGLHQHTGNWPGKTVANAQGYCKYKENGFVLVDLPGCYSLMAHSAEEEVARDFICFGGADATIIVCDATCLQRNLNLVLQTLEITSNVVVCVNLMDEAKKKKIKINLNLLSEKLGVPVIGTSARSKHGLDDLMDAVSNITNGNQNSPLKIKYPDYIEYALSILEPQISAASRWSALTLLSSDAEFIEQNKKVKTIIRYIREDFAKKGITEKQITEDIVSSTIHTAEDLCKETVVFENANYKNGDSKIDNILTGKWTAFPIMILALMGVFWLTITGSNYPSQVISGFLFWIEDRLLALFIQMGAPKFLTEMLILGVYRVLAWVVSVMLPPMAIFFPLFTLMEDVGFLPRVAFNLDKCFKKCCACGKQCLTMCMGIINLQVVDLLVFLIKMSLYFPALQYAQDYSGVLALYPLIKQS